jgi:hypothetical protein
MMIKIIRLWNRGKVIVMDIIMIMNMDMTMRLLKLNFTSRNRRSGTMKRICVGLHPLKSEILVL